MVSLLGRDNNGEDIKATDEGHRRGYKQATSTRKRSGIRSQDDATSAVSSLNLWSHES